MNWSRSPFLQRLGPHFQCSFWRREWQGSRSSWAGRLMIFIGVKLLDVVTVISKLRTSNFASLTTAADPDLTIHSKLTKERFTHSPVNEFLVSSHFPVLNEVGVAFVGAHGDVRCVNLLYVALYFIICPAISFPECGNIVTSARLREGRRRWWKLYIQECSVDNLQNCLCVYFGNYFQMRVSSSCQVVFNLTSHNFMQSSC